MVIALLKSGLESLCRYYFWNFFKTDLNANRVGARHPSGAFVLRHSSERHMLEALT